MLEVFKYEDRQPIRTVNKDGEIWFYATDICKILDIGNPAQTCSRLDEDEKTIIISNDNGHPIRRLLVNESGLYALILGSKKTEAKAFRKWITNKVLPSIRKTGGYLTDKNPTTPIFVRRFNDNWDRISQGYFSIISELYIRIYGKLEQVGYILPDKGESGKEIRPDISVGKLFPKWLESNYPEYKQNYKTYRHRLPNGEEIDARQYSNELLSVFVKYVDENWLLERSYDYFKEKDKNAFKYLVKICPRLLEINKEVKKAIQV